jgi:hypothetical protein
VSEVWGYHRLGVAKTGGDGLMAMKVWLEYMLKKQQDGEVNEFENTTAMEYTDTRPFRREPE